MQDWQFIIFGVALGAVPTATLGRIGAAWLAKRVGLKPSDLREYAEASDGDDESGS